MTPNADVFKNLLNQIRAQYPDEERSLQLRNGNIVGERHLLISCVIACAEAVERQERVITEVITPALQMLLNGNKSAAAVPATGAVEETEDMPPIAHSTVAGSSPATKAGEGGMVTMSAPQPIAPNSNGRIVTISEPTPIPPRS